MKLDTRNRDIIIIGYYGQGNLGDDLLALYVIQLLQKVISTNRIMVTAPEGNYLEKWFPGIMSVSLPCAFHHLTNSPKKVVFGGGGLFFQFNKPNLINLFGAKGNLMWHCWRHASKEIKKGLRLYAFCIGIGPLYGFGAKLITRKLCSIIDHVSLRDETSARFLSSIHCAVVTDPVIGLNDLFVRDDNFNQKAIGIIIRDWASSEKLILKLHQVAEKLRKAGFEVTFISFERKGDAQTIALLKKLGEMNLICWDPTIQNIIDFCKVLSGYPLLITMRAHAIILGAILGLKVIGISIEQKIEIFTKQFGFCNYHIDKHDDADKIFKSILEAAKSKQIIRDFAREKLLLANESQKLLGWLQSSSNHSIY